MERVGTFYWPYNADDPSLRLCYIPELSLNSLR